jgi:hypothetical protein
MNQWSQQITVDMNPHKSWFVDKDFNSRIRKGFANILTTNQQFTISGLEIKVILRCYVS